MTLRELCNLLGWEPLRRWAAFIHKVMEMDGGPPKHGGSTCAEIDDELNDHLQENHRLRGALNDIVTSQSEAHQEIADREQALRRKVKKTRESLRKEKAETQATLQQAEAETQAEIARLKAEYVDFLNANDKHLRLEPVRQSYLVGKMDGSKVEEVIWTVPQLDQRFTKFFHRVDGPALTIESTEKWYYMNALHRLDGPAWTGVHGKSYYLDGNRYSRADWMDEVERRTGTRPPDTA